MPTYRFRGVDWYWRAVSGHLQASSIKEVEAYCRSRQIRPDRIWRCWLHDLRHNLRGRVGLLAVVASCGLLSRYLTSRNSKDAQDAN